MLHVSVCLSLTHQILKGMQPAGECVHVQDEATMQELTTEDITQDVKGWLQSVRIMLFRPNMAAIVRSDRTLVRIHSTAEQFEAVPENFMGFFQVSTCPFTLSYLFTLSYWSFTL